MFLHVLASKAQSLHQAMHREDAHADAIDSGEEGKSMGREKGK